MRGLGLVLRSVWSCACGVALIYPLWMASATPVPLRHHWYEIQVLWMMILSFPSGAAYYVALALGLTVLDTVAGMSLGNTVAFVVLLQWLPAAAVGYWQWFIWLPRRLPAWRTRRQ
jgi:hypothetical protein